jgi:segregation and condensation protein A
MNLGVATHQARAYSVATPIYEGPLDLLLQLIERAELDITKLSLAQVTDQYLERLRTLQEQAVEEVSAFLVIAARLLQIKSEILLPRPVVREEGEEDPGEALARQLIIYKRFKEIGQMLAGRESAGLRTFLRVAPPLKVEPVLDISGLNLADLLAAAQLIFLESDRRSPLDSVVAAPRITIREKIGLIARFLRRHGHATFRGLLSRRPTQLDIVVTFLAMLELIKRRMVLVRQEDLFGEIELERSGEWEEDEAFELEFGE